MNVEDSDGTLILNMGELAGGTLQTLRFAQKAARPVLPIQVDNGVTPDHVSMVKNWLLLHSIERLNVAGPRESKRPGIYQHTLDLLSRALGPWPYRPQGVTQHEA